ncbi:hypothetical protein S245_041693 [Arachis hypogaea]
MLAGGIRHYPVVYSDGEREVNVGTVSVDPAEISFKRLLRHLSNKVGIPSEDLIVYLSSADSGRKVLLFEKLDLSLVLPSDRSGEHYFHVVKRLTKGSAKKNAASVVKKKRRVDPVRAAMEALQELRVRAISAKAPLYMEEELEEELRKRDLFIEKRGLLTNMAINDNVKIPKKESNGCAVERSDGAREGRGILKICRVCQRARMTGIGDGGFHPCVYDKIIQGFRQSRWGPISPSPVRNFDKDLFDEDFLSSVMELEKLIRKEMKEMKEMSSDLMRCDIL